MLHHSVLNLSLSKGPLTFCTWEINTPLLKLGSGASDSAKLFLLPALLATAGAAIRLCVSNCWLEEGHLPFRMAWQMLSMRLMITRSCKEGQTRAGWGLNDVNSGMSPQKQRQTQTLVTSVQQGTALGWVVSGLLRAP